MEVNFKEFQEKFRTNDLKIYETDYWIWSLRPGQCTVGASILSLKRYTERLSDITEKESTDYVNIIKVIENTLHEVFSYDKINYLMLMMVDAQTHYHVVPRYSKEIKFKGIKWVDKGWPALPILTANIYDDKVLFAIKDHIISTIK